MLNHNRLPTSGERVVPRSEVLKAIIAEIVEYAKATDQTDPTKQPLESWKRQQEISKAIYASYLEHIYHLKEAQATILGSRFSCIDIWDHPE